MTSRTTASSAGASLVAALLGPRAWLMACIAVMLLTMPGCGGCLSKTPKTAAQKKKEEEERKKKEEEEKKKKPKPDFEATPMRFVPADPETVFNYFKPGHWVTTEQGIRANNFDFSAVVAERPKTTSDQKPVLIRGTNYYLRTTRRASLAKGQARFVESVCMAPMASADRNIMISSELLQSRSGTKVFADTGTAVRMEHYQYIFLVLSSLPDNYTYVKTLPTIEPTVLDQQDRRATFFRVITPRIDRRISVPSHALTWTSISYVLWDRVNAELMTKAQKQAMIDWLHWGGQLIVSGPANLDNLKSSFLADYLPAEHDGPAEFTASDFDELNDHFSLYSKKRKAKQNFELLESEKLVGVKWKLRPGSYAVPKTGGLVAERRVGRGRVVVTAFPLDSRHFKRWGSADNFFNCCLMRRPGRRFGQSGNYNVTMAFNGVNNTWDSRLGSGLRYFTRDLPPFNEAPDGAVASRNRGAAGKFEGFAAWTAMGSGGWNDTSGTSVACRRALQLAAGIEVPRAEFVLKAVGFYLLVLVPLNWLVFRLMGKVEWAWVAAPVIAVIGSVFVVRYAQLDIGFDSSLTEAAIVELQPGYDRAHVTRYMALYSSLSTNFELELDNASSLAIPFPADVEWGPGIHEQLREVTLNRGANVKLTNFQVDSNYTGMLHSEQMKDFGTIALEPGADGEALSLANKTDVKLLDAMVLRRNPNGALEKCYLETVEPSATRPLTMEAVAHGTISQRFPEWQREAGVFAAGAEKLGELSLGGLAELAVGQLALKPGESRLVAWTDEPIVGAAVRPTPAKMLHRTMIVAQLEGAPWGAPDSDRSLLMDTIEEQREAIDTLLEDDPAAPARP